MVAFTAHTLHEEEATPESRYVSGLAPTAQPENRWL